jgi:hypothetical protein
MSEPTGPIDSADLAETDRADGEDEDEEDGEDEDEEDGEAGWEADEDDDYDPDVRPRRAPWHFKVLLVGTVIYLGWRAYQGIGWLIHHV